MTGRHRRGQLTRLASFLKAPGALLSLLALSACTSGSANSPAGTSTIENQVATCTTPLDPASPATLLGSITPANPTFELVCQGANSQAVPAGLGRVCKHAAPTSTTRTPGPTTLSECSANESGQQCLLSTLLFPGAKAAWKQVTGTPGNTGEKRYQLTIPKEEFPVLEKQFLVGCMEASKSQSSCQVNITVSARASEVSADNVVTCAYGQQSNDSALTVAVTSEKNSFTLRCGSEGAQIPADKQDYCSGASVDECTPQNLTALIPNAEASWWTDPDEQKTMTFTIPKDKFPSADTAFLVGCTASKTGGKTSCNVKVTVKAPVGSGSQRDTFSLGVILSVGLVSVCYLA